VGAAFGHNRNQAEKTRSFSRNLPMRLERDDIETRGPRQWGKSDVCRVAEFVLGVNLPKSKRREEAALGWGRLLGVALGDV
jgi:hypothetical protein